MNKEKEKQDKPSLYDQLVDVSAPVPTIVPTPTVKAPEPAPVVIPAPIVSPQPAAAPAIDMAMLATLVATAVKQTLESQNQPVQQSYGGSPIATPDAEDILPEEDTVTFAMRGAGWFTRSYIRNNQTFVAPYGIIRFDEVITDIETNARGEEDVLRISTFACRSKKELAYLRNHPELGYTFTEVDGMNLGQMITNPRYLETQTSIFYLNQVRAMEPHLKIQMARELGIDVNNPSVNIDAELINHRMKDDKRTMESMKARRVEALTPNAR